MTNMKNDMTEEEIKKLSAEYAEAVCPIEDYDELDDPLRETDIQICEYDAKSVLTWLSERFCIVEKSKVKEVYANHIDNIKSSCFEYLAPQVENYMQACYRSALQKLFGKSLFEEENK